MCKLYQVANVATALARAASYPAAVPGAMNV